MEKVTTIPKKFKNLDQEDFYTDAKGMMVFTEIYHKKRGYCCKLNCKHCPFGHALKKI